MHIPNVPITRRVVYRSGAIRCSLSRVNEARFGLGALALRGPIASIPIQGPLRFNHRGSSCGGAYEISDCGLQIRHRMSALPPKAADCLEYRPRVNPRGIAQIGLPQHRGQRRQFADRDVHGSLSPVLRWQQTSVSAQDPGRVAALSNQLPVAGGFRGATNLASATNDKLWHMLRP
jgi:hypothetical protein